MQETNFGTTASFIGKDANDDKFLHVERMLKNLLKEQSRKLLINPKNQKAIDLKIEIQHELNDLVNNIHLWHLQKHESGKISFKRDQ